MGFFSDVGDFFGDVVKPIVDPISSVVGSVGSIVGSSQQNATAKQIAKDNNHVAIQLANTAHQREIKDLKAAGLNPILSAGGSGASTPQMQGWDPQNVVEPAIASAMAFKRLSADLENINADTDKKQQEAALSKKLQIQSDETAKLIRQQEYHESEKRVKTSAETRSAAMDYFLKEAQTKLSEANAATAREQARLTRTDADFAPLMKKLEAANTTARTVGGILSDITPLGKMSKFPPPMKGR